MVESKDACPKCGKLQWWESITVLNKSGKTVTIISYCNHCGSYFKQIKNLIRVDSHDKIIGEESVAFDK